MFENRCEPRSRSSEKRERVLEPLRALSKLGGTDWQNLPAQDLRDAVEVLEHSSALALKWWMIRTEQSHARPNAKGDGLGSSLKETVV